MLRKVFVNRYNELQSLNKTCEKPGFEFIVLTGRRRIGKTRLLQEFSKSKKPLFLMCEERKWQYNLDKFNETIAEYFQIPSPHFSSFKECFKYVTDQTKGNKIIIIDEFSYLIKNKEILGEFQSIVDEILQEKDATLVLSGSAVSMMKKQVLGHKSPLYGRTTQQLNLQPLTFSNILKWFPDVSIVDAIKIYGVCDGIPKYLEFFQGKNVEKEITNNFFNPDTFLFREPKLLLEEELREPETYFQILEAMSLGYTKTVEIANYSYMEAKNIVSYLSILRDLGFVKKEKSLLSKKRKRGTYSIRDNFFRFWFRFVSSYFADIENWNAKAAVQEFNVNFNSYLSPVFEDVCKQFVRNRNDFQKIGRWWYKDVEIDIVALNEKDSSILFGECKWSKNKIGTKVLSSLESKKEKVQWKNKTRKERFVLFSKTGFRKSLVDLAEERKDLELVKPQDMGEAFRSAS